MKKILWVFLTILTIFICIPASLAFVDLLKNVSISSRIELAFFIGFIFYLVVHIIFYKPVFMHVMAHELTHILWAFLFGGQAKEMKVSVNGGRVLINRTNFIITLAPYFFPLYTFLCIGVYLMAKDQFLPYIAFFIGASLAFHIALTLFSMRASQSDFYEDSNVFFSLSFVFIMNLIVIAFVLSLMSDKVKFLDFMKGIAIKSVWIVQWIAGFAKNMGR